MGYTGSVSFPEVFLCSRCPVCILISVLGSILTLTISYSILPALSLDGILHVNIITGSFTTETFCAFIKGLLENMNPYPGPNSVIIMDNCRIHKSDIVTDLIEARLVLILAVGLCTNEI